MEKASGHASKCSNMKVRSIGDIEGVIHSGCENCGGGNEISISSRIYHNAGPSKRKMRTN